MQLTWLTEKEIRLQDSTSLFFTTSRRTIMVLKCRNYPSLTNCGEKGEQKMREPDRLHERYKRLRCDVCESDILSLQDG